MSEIVDIRLIAGDGACLSNRTDVFFAWAWGITLCWQWPAMVIGDVHEAPEHLMGSVKINLN